MNDLPNGATAASARSGGEYRPHNAWLLPCIILGLGWTACACAMQWARTNARRQDARTAQHLVDDLAGQINSKFEIYTAPLMAGQGFVRTWGHPSRAQWRELCASLGVPDRFPGFGGLGLVYPVEEGHLLDFVALMQAGGELNYAVHAPGGQAATGGGHALVAYIEPEQTHAAALGLDVLADPLTRDAALSSRDLNAPRITRQRVFVEGHRPMSLLFVPVYRSGAIPGTPEGRRAALVAWVYAPFAFYDWIPEVLEDNRRRMDLRFYEGYQTDGVSPIYGSDSSSDPRQPQYVAHLEIAGQRYTLAGRTGPYFPAVPLVPEFLAVSVAAVATAFFAWLVWSLAARRADLERDVAARTKQLRESEESYRLQFRENFAVMLLIDPASGDIVDANSAAERFYGYQRERLLGMKIWEINVLPEDVVMRAMGSISSTKGSRFEFRHRMADGTERTVEAFSSRIVFAERQVLHTIVADITERKRAEQALRDSEERYRQLFEAETDAILVFEAESRRIVSVNEAAVRTYGWSRGEFAGLSISEIARESDQGRHRRRDGTVFPVDVMGSQFVERGRKMEVLAVRDITQRLAAESTLRLHDAALEAAANSIVITNERGIILWANKAFTDSTGWPIDFVVGKNPREFLKSGAQDMAFYRKMWRAISSGDVWRGEMLNRKRDGSLAHEEMTITPIKDSSGRITHFIAIKQDIAERKASERALRETEERFSKVFHAAPVPVVISRLEDGVIVDVNKEFLNVSGFSMDEVIGRSTVEIGGITAEDRDRLVQHMLKGRVERLHLTLHAKGGRPVECVVHGDIIEIGGQRRILTILMDVTDSRRLEAQLRQAQKMEAVGQLAGGVAHDFNNILSAIMLNLGMLKEEPRLSPENRSILRELEREATRAANLTRQLLVFSRQQAMQVSAIDLNSLVANLLKMLRRLIGENIAIDWRPEPDLPPMEGDVGMIEQVLMNLCVNARDAMPHGGRLELRTTCVSVGRYEAISSEGAEPGMYLRLSVTDTGSGMDEQTRAHLFEPFFTTKDAGKGTGLGLATVYGIVRQHKGWIDVETAPGEGASFHVFLPCRGARVEEAPGDQTPRIVRGNGETILLVEDEGPIRATLSVTLKSFGYNVVEARSGPDALTHWEKVAPTVALVLSDMVMPEGMDGAALVRRLRERRPDLKAVIMSGYVPNHEALQTLDYRFLPKPFNVPELLATVRAVLEQN